MFVCGCVLVYISGNVSLLEISNTKSNESRHGEILASPVPSMMRNKSDQLDHGKSVCVCVEDLPKL